MKRILEYGKYNKVTCSECQCTFTFEQCDVINEDKVTCPCCNNENNAPKKPEPTV